VRDELERQIEQLRGNVVAMGERADQMLAEALIALRESDVEAAERVIEADDAVDRAYEQVQNGVLAVVALHSPVGHDLRLLTSLIHVSLHAERMGDYAAGVARITTWAAEHAPDRDLLEQLLEMGELARAVGQKAMEAFVAVDPEKARAVSGLDDGVDRLNTGIFQRLVRLASADDDLLRWATRMIQLTRALERYADHGVDIAEQAIFAATGEAVDLARGPGPAAV